MARYTPDPGARHNGIYLVLWFGGKGMSMPPNGAPKPRSAQALEATLLAQLTPAERRRVAVVVLDCSQPQAESLPPAVPVAMSGRPRL